MKNLVSIVLLSMCSFTAFADTDLDIRIALNDKIQSLDYTCEQTNSIGQTFDMTFSILNYGLIKNEDYIVDVDEESQPAIIIESSSSNSYIYKYKIHTFDNHHEISSFTLTLKTNLGEGQVNIGSLTRPEMVTKTKTSMYSSHTCTVNNQELESIEP
jgi:hypothetical protein